MSTTALDAVTRYFAAVDSHDIDAIVSTLTEDVVFGNVTQPTPARGHDEVADTYRAFFAAFPDLHHDNSYTPAADGQSVFVEGHVKGTFSSGEYQGSAPTGNTVNVPFLTVCDVRDGKVAHVRAYYHGADFDAQALGT